jgi:phospholipid-binding lipoprotein MlaA
MVGKTFKRGRAAVSLGFAAALAVAGCATVPEGDPEAMAAYEEANDPLEPMNRYFFEVNYAADELLLKPLAGWYYTALPNPVQDSVRNVLRNASTPVVLVNDLLQGSWERAEITIMRFLINTTVGLAGLFDVASEWGYAYHDEDFGQTLAVHDVGEGPYLVLPVLGPSNPRDAVGRGVDSLIDPLGWVLPPYVGLARAGVRGIDTRARNLKTLDEIREGSVDYYAAIRSLYRQRRTDEINNGESPDGVAYPGSAKAPDLEPLEDPEEMSEGEPDAGLQLSADEPTLVTEEVN